MTPVSESLTISATTNINVKNYQLYNFYASSSLTSWTATISNLIDGATATIDYLKTTSTDCNITFPTGSIISIGSDAVISSTTATLNSTSSGRFTITLTNVNGVYKIYIIQDVL